MIIVNKIRKLWSNQKGFAMVTYLLIFALAFPIAMLLPDMILWGSGWYKAQSIMNEVAQYLGEHGGASPETVTHLQLRFEEAGLNPSQWDLTITPGPLLHGEQGAIRVDSTYQFKSVSMFFDLELPVYASALFTSEAFPR